MSSNRSPPESTALGRPPIGALRSHLPAFEVPLQNFDAHGLHYFLTFSLCSLEAPSPFIIYTMPSPFNCNVTLTYSPRSRAEPSRVGSSRAEPCRAREPNAKRHAPMISQHSDVRVVGRKRGRSVACFGMDISKDPFTMIDLTTVARETHGTECAVCMVRTVLNIC
jgi:hypothetical protein